MWRAFFFAVGIMLIILGLECLVTERFVVTNGRIPNALAKIMDSGKSTPNPPAMGAIAARQMVPGPNATLPFGRQPINSSVSKYGPSRFNDQFGQVNGVDFYGGAPAVRQPFNTNNSLPNYNPPFGAVPQATNSPFGLASYGNPNAPTTLRPATTTLKARVLAPKEWMPWSLLAAGTLIVLYTNSTRRRYSAD